MIRAENDTNEIGRIIANLTNVLAQLKARHNSHSRTKKSAKGRSTHDYTGASNRSIWRFVLHRIAGWGQDRERNDDRVSAVTHGFNMGQRIVRPPFSLATAGLNVAGTTE